MDNWIFDSNNKIWIVLYKRFSIFILFAIPIIGMVLLIVFFLDNGASFYDLLVNPILLIFSLILFSAISFVIYTINMIIINMLHNIQQSKNLLEEISKNRSLKS